MSRKFNYEIGDYVKYEGNLQTSSNVLRDPDFGRIDEIEVQHDRERIYLYLLTKKQHIWCDFRDIRQITTEPEHLSALNFNTFEVNGRKKYELDAITISGVMIRTPHTNYLFHYNVGDFTKGIPNIESYFSNGKMDLQRFTNDYPDVSNLNDLLSFLESQGRIIDKETIVRSTRFYVPKAES